MMKLIIKINKLIFFILLSCLFITNLHSMNAQSKKLVGLIQVRNESNIIKQCLKALSLYTDAIVLLDDASDDNTVSICESLANECNIERIIRNESSAWLNRTDYKNRQKLLDVGRAIGGSHFIFIDADEMLTSNCLKDNFLRNKILSLEPGDQLVLMWIQLWRSVKKYRFDNSVWTWNYKRIIFCDDGKSSYDSSFIHGPQCPQGLSGKVYKIDGYEYGLLHFQFVNWKNLLIKQAWYRCLEHISFPNKSIGEINSMYGISKDERGLSRKDCPSEWFEGYASFFDGTVFDKLESWRQEQVRGWFKQYNKGYFAQLDIWDVDWSNSSER